MTAPASSVADTTLLYLRGEVLVRHVPELGPQALWVRTGGKVREHLVGVLGEEVGAEFLEVFLRSKGVSTERLDPSLFVEGVGLFLGEGGTSGGASARWEGRPP